MTIYETIYSKLDKLTGGIEEFISKGEPLRIENPPYMRLTIEVLHVSGTIAVISLTHYYEQNGDLVPDPDMEVRIYLEHRVAEALTYQDAFGYRVVYPGPNKVDLKAKGDLNRFLKQWLGNLKQQGFFDVTPTVSEVA